MCTNIALTVDLEDWYHGMEGVSGRSTVLRDTEQLLEMFRSFDVHATFFVLADVALKNKDLIRLIQSSGHEIGFHGVEHDFLGRLGSRRFRQEIQSGKTTLENLTGARVKGFRAPFFSITKNTAWAVSILAESGFEYDSSVYPGYNDRYGWPKAPPCPFRFMPDGLLEFPVPVTRWPFSLAFSGGAYLRILPWRLIRKQLDRYQNIDAKGMVYIHPWEISGDIPRIWKNNFRAGLTRYLGLKGMRARLQGILEGYGHKMAPMHEIVSGLKEIPEWWYHKDHEQSL